MNRRSDVTVVQNEQTYVQVRHKIDLAGIESQRRREIRELPLALDKPNIEPQIGENEKRIVEEVDVENIAKLESGRVGREFEPFEVQFRVEAKPKGLLRLEQHAGVDLVAG